MKNKIVIEIDEVELMNFNPLGYWDAEIEWNGKVTYSFSVVLKSKGIPQMVIFAPTLTFENKDNREEFVWNDAGTNIRYGGYGMNKTLGDELSEQIYLTIKEHIKSIFGLQAMNNKTFSRKVSFPRKVLEGWEG